MTDVCLLGFDADDVATLLGRGATQEEAERFRSHVPDCASCARTASMWEQLHATWQGSVERDESAREASERRLTLRLPRRAAPRPWAFATGGALVTGLLVGALLVPHSAAPTGAVVVQQGGPPEGGTAMPSLQRAEVDASSTPRSVATRGLSSIVAVRPCAACSGVIDTGTTILVADRVVVPRGSTLSLNWAVEGGLVDPAAGVDVLGPAIVRSSEVEGASALYLEEGGASAWTTRRAAVDGAHVQTRGEGAAWQVDVRDGRTRVVVTRGMVEVQGVGARAEHAVLSAGERRDVLVDGRLATVTATAAPPSALPGAASSNAEETLPSVTAAAGHEADERARASFAQAESDLGHGATDAARKKLYPLLDAADPSLAGDAAFMLARSFAAPRDRVKVLEQYLAKGPPSPYSDQAAVERGMALLDAGDVAGAVEAVRVLRARPAVAEVTRPALARLERRIAALKGP